MTASPHANIPWQRFRVPSLNWIVFHHLGGQSIAVAFGFLAPMMRYGLGLSGTRRYIAQYPFIGVAMLQVKRIYSGVSQHVAVRRPAAVAGGPGLLLSLISELLA